MKRLVRNKPSLIFVAKGRPNIIKNTLKVLDSKVRLLALSTGVRLS